MISTSSISLPTASLPCMLPTYLNSGSPGSWRPGRAEISMAVRLRPCTDWPMVYTRVMFL